MDMRVAAATSAMATQVPRICSSASTLPRSTPTEKAMSSRKVAFGFANIFPTTSSTRSLVILASKSQDKQVNLNTENPDPAFTSQEDLNYLLKLGAGSVMGAVAIKYGSVLLPEITRPNIVQALAMISAPVVVAVLLLIKESRNE